MRANFVLSGVAAGIRRNVLMFAALVLVVSIALGFVGAALLANTEITKFRDKYVNKINVSVYLCATEPQSPCKAKTTAAQTASIQSALESYPKVTSVEYISEQQAFELGKEQQPDVAKYLKVGVLPASFTVKLQDVQRDYDAFAAQFSEMAGVGVINNQIDTINTLLDIINGVRSLAFGVALVVLLASILLIVITVQVAATQRRNETSIMRLVGASRWMTELPFILETMIAAAVGGLLAMLGLWVGKTYVLDTIFEGPTKRGVIPNLSVDNVLTAGGMGLIVGIILSAITAFGTLRLRVKL